jgi:hypothetical protein
MWNGPADRIRRLHRAHPEFSPAEIAEKLNGEKDPNLTDWREKQIAAKPISNKYVSKILRRDGAAEKFKTGPKPRGPAAIKATATTERETPCRTPRQKND